VEEEAAQARALQRHAFSQPDGSSPAPTGLGQRRELRVATHEGRVVSCLTLLHAELGFLGARLPMAGICEVATDPDQRNKGYAGELMRRSLREMRERGICTSALFPFSFRYYRKFGYELGGNHCHFWCRPSCIPAFGEYRLARPARAGDVPALTRFSAQRAAGLTCALTRDAKRWSSLCSDPSVRLTVCGDGEIEGYLASSEVRDAYGGRVLRVLELTAAGTTGWRTLLGELARVGAESIEWNACDADLRASGMLRSTAPLREGFKPRAIVTVRPMFQFRVVDVEGALRARAAAFSEGRDRLALRLDDEVLPANQAPVTVQRSGGGVEVRPARASDPWLKMDIRTFSQVFCGYLSPSDAASQGLASASSPAALETAEQLFPSGEPFLSELDRF